MVPLGMGRAAAADVLPMMTPVEASTALAKLAAAAFETIAR